MRPHEFRELVNELRDTAVKFHDHQSLRERVVHVLWAHEVFPDAQPTPSVPDGYKLMPVEPTTIMKQYAGSVEVGDSDIGRFVLSWDEIESIYAAMIDAAPEAKP